MYNTVNFNAYNKAPKDYLTINIRVAKAKVNKYYTKLDLLLVYYAVTILYLCYKTYYNVV
jgi:hypothetical protein